MLISSGNGRLVGLRVVQAPAVKFQGCLTIVFCSTTFVSQVMPHGHLIIAGIAAPPILSSSHRAKAAWGQRADDIFCLLAVNKDS